MEQILSQLLPVLIPAGLLALAYVVIRRSRSWVPFYGSPGHRPENLLRVREHLRRAGVRHRMSNVVNLGSEATMGVGMSTTLLVHRDDIGFAHRVLAEQEDGPSSFGRE